MPHIENTQVYGLENAIRCAKFPMAVDTHSVNSELTKGIKNLANSGIGEGHDNFLNGIIVQFDLTFSIKAWIEEERYHFFEFISSQSTMHRITKFNLKEQCNLYVDDRILDIVQEKIDEYNRLCALSGESTDNGVRQRGLYLQILYNIPSGLELTAGMTTNYRQLKTVYHQRRNHRLPDWKMLCNWCETLPMFRELCIERNNTNA